MFNKISDFIIETPLTASNIQKLSSISTPMLVKPVI